MNDAARRQQMFPTLSAGEIDWRSRSAADCAEKPAGAAGGGRNGHRQALPPESSLPGVFATGDVRPGSVKRVGGAIGEGAAVVAQLHSFLGSEPNAWAGPLASAPAEVRSARTRASDTSPFRGRPA
jgi:hypothetical protein